MLIRFPSLLILVAPAMLQASESRFAFLQESLVAEPEELELEITSTYHRGGEQFYSRMDNALEFEYGLREHLQTAVYLTYSSVTEDDGSGTLQTEAQLRGVSAEVKYQLTDRTTQALGSALYVEAGLGSEEAELEGKVIIDAHLGPWVVGYNAVYECEMENEADETEYAHIFENQVGLSYGIEDDFSFGLEVRTHHIRKEDEGTRGALYAGPTMAGEFGRMEWKLCAQWQLTALGSSDPHEQLELQEHTRLVARLVIGFEL